MEWKSVEKDGLPKKKYGRFIVNVYEDDEHGDFVMEATFVEGSFQANGMIPIANIVTHWIEMPDPPQRQ